MRFMFIVCGPEDFGKAGPPPKALYEAIDKLGREGLESGKIVSMGGLQPTASGVRMRSTGGKLVTTDGPFTEAKEVIGGFTIMDLPSRKAALEEMRSFMELHRTHWPAWEGVCEMRQMYEEGDKLPGE